MHVLLACRITPCILNFFITLSSKINLQIADYNCERPLPFYNSVLSLLNDGATDLLSILPGILEILNLS